MKYIIFGVIALFLSVGVVEAAVKILEVRKPFAQIITPSREMGVYKVLDGTTACYVVVTKTNDYTEPSISCVK